MVTVKHSPPESYQAFGALFLVEILSDKVDKSPHQKKMQNQVEGYYSCRPSFRTSSDSSEEEDRFTPRSPPQPPPQLSIPGRNSAMVNQSRNCSRNLTENNVFGVPSQSIPFGNLSPRVVFTIPSSMDSPWSSRIASSDEDYHYSSSSPTYSNEEMYKADDVDPDGRKSDKNKADLWAEIYSQALGYTDQLLRSLPPKSCDIPPGRLPVCITPEDTFSGDGIRMEIDLRTNKTTILVQGGGGSIPAKLRVEHPANAHLPSMRVTEEEVERWLDQACVHLVHFAGALMTLLSSPMEEESLVEPEDYSAAFEVFKEEFEAFDEVVSFALEGLLKHDVELVKRYKDVRKMFWRLEYASSLGAVYHQEAHFDAASTEVDQLQRAVRSFRRNRV